MYLRRWEAREVGKAGVEIENPHNKSFFLLSFAKRYARVNNEIADKLSSSTPKKSNYKYVVIDKLTGEKVV